MINYLVKSFKRAGIANTTKIINFLLIIVKT
jgi:hypothetical protein